MRQAELTTAHTSWNAAINEIPVAMCADVASLREAELIERFRTHRDDRCFEALYLQARRTVYAICLHYLRDPYWAEDACHDAFVQAYERFHSLRGTNFLAWVRRIARNLCLNHLRHRRIGDRTEAALPPEPEVAGADRPAIARQELGIALEVIRSLAPEQQRVFLLRHADGMSYREIEEQTGFDSERVRSTLQSSRRNFHRRWQQAIDEPAQGAGGKR